MKYVTVPVKHTILRAVLRKPDKRYSDLSWLDKVVLDRCKGEGARIQLILHACKPYRNEWSSREFATTEEVVKAVKKLVSLKLLRRI